MKLKNVERAYISKEKVLYLLTYREENDKSKFFKSFSFSAEHWEKLHVELLEQAKQGEVVLRSEERDFEKIEVVGILQTPDERNPKIKTIWHIDNGKDYPRFITAHPYKR